MREIKFRGINFYSREWLYGGYHKHEEDVQIIHEQGINLSHHTPVIPDSVSQFTGYIDKNGVEIYEGDVVRFWGGEYAQGYWEYAGSKVIDIHDCAWLDNVDFVEIMDTPTKKYLR